MNACIYIDIYICTYASIMRLSELLISLQLAKGLFIVKVGYESLSWVSKLHLSLRERITGLHETDDAINLVRLFTNN